MIHVLTRSSLLLLESNLLWIVRLLEWSSTHHLVFWALPHEVVVLLKLMVPLLVHVLAAHHPLSEGSFIPLLLVRLMVLEQLILFDLRWCGSLVETSCHYSKDVITYTVFTDT